MLRGERGGENAISHSGHVVMDDPALGVKSSTSAFVMINVGKGMIMTMREYRVAYLDTNYTVCTAELGASDMQLNLQHGGNTLHSSC